MAVDTSQIDPESILDFWFGDAAGDPERAQERQEIWFGASDAIDAQIRQRFGAAIEMAARGEVAHWRNAARPALALVLGRESTAAERAFLSAGAESFGQGVR